MGIQIFVNNFTSTLGSAIVAGDTSIPLATGAGANLPALSGGDWILLTIFEMSGVDEINHEVIKVTAKATDTLTAVRAQEGTTARNFASGTKIHARMTKGSVEGLQCVGKHTIGVPAGGLFPATTNGCAALAQAETATNKINYKYLAFDAAAVEYAWFSFPSPKSYNASTMAFRAVWAHPATATNFKVAWDIQMLSLADGDAIDTALGTAVQVNDTGGTTGVFYTSPESAAVTPGNTASKQDWIFARISRVATDATNDTLAVDAHLIGVEVYYYTDAATDA